MQLFVENRGPYKCLADSGTEMPVAKRAVVQDVMSADQPAQPVGHVKLQGIFGEPVLAELMSLQVKLADGHDRFVSVPLVFAVTDAMVQSCDFIILADTVDMLKSHYANDCEESDQAVTSSVLTRSQAVNAPVTGQVNNSDVSGDDEPPSQSPVGDGEVGGEANDVDNTDLVNVDNPTVYPCSGSD